MTSLSLSTLRSTVPAPSKRPSHSALVPTSVAFLPTRHLIAVLVLFLLIATLFTKARTLQTHLTLSHLSSTSTSTSTTITSCDVSQRLPISLLSVSALDADLSNDPSLTTTTGINRNLPTPPSLLHYISFHHAARARCATSSEQCAALVWVCAGARCGGVGDRMRGIRLAFLLAVATRRLFFVHWPRTSSAPFDLTAALHPAAIDWRVPVNTSLHGTLFHFPSSHLMVMRRSYTLLHDTQHREEEEEKENDDGPWHWKGDYNTTTTDFHSLFEHVHGLTAFVSNRVIARSALLNLTDNAVLSDALSDLRRDHNDQVALERRLTRVLFRPAPPVASAVRARVPPPRRNAHNVTYVSLHARTGDDVGESGNVRLRHNDRVRSLLVDRLVTCAEILHRFVYRHDTTSGAAAPAVFFASDSVRLKAAFGAAARARGLVVHTADAHRKVVHVDRYGGEGTRREEVCEGFVDVFADLYALAGATALAFFHSGYPATALAMSTINRWKELKADEKPPYKQRECMFGKRDADGNLLAKGRSTFQSMYGGT